jgi:quercetin dioxygenase-like cupin family protein
MKELSRAIMGVLLVSVVSVFAARPAMGQDPAKVAGDIYKVLLENDRVRVLEAKLKPGDKTALHSHPANIIYSFTDSKAKFAPSGGKATIRPMKAGAVLWSPPETHVSENAGKTEAHVLIFELKKLGRHGTQASGADPVKADPAHFKVRLNNASVRVLEFRGKPGDKFPMHSHPDYVAYTFSGGKTTYSFPDGKTAERQVTAGNATWNESETHAGQIGDTETHTLLVELKATRATPKK